jgi:cell division protein ZapA
MDTPDARKQIVRVTIFNQTYNISTSDDPRDTEHLAHQVDELMATIARQAGNLDTARAAVLACLHLADKLRATERELDALKQCVTHKSRDFAELLDRVLPAQQEE